MILESGSNTLPWYAREKLYWSSSLIFPKLWVLYALISLNILNRSYWLVQFNSPTFLMVFLLANSFGLIPKTKTVPNSQNWSEYQNQPGFPKLVQIPKISLIYIKVDPKKTKLSDLIGWYNLPCRFRLFRGFYQFRNRFDSLVIHHQA